MKILARLLIVFSFFAVTGANAAGLLLEPYAGYAMTSMELKAKSGSEAGVTVKYGHNSIGLGGRLGYILPAGLWFAGDYFMQMEGDITRDPSSSGSAPKASMSTLFIDIGFDVPAIPLRIWGGYGVMNDWVWKSSTGDLTFFGPAYKFGIGFKAIPLLSINVEYMMHNHDKLKTSTTELKISDVYDGYKAQTIFVSLSVPFSPMGK